MLKYIVYKTTNTINGKIYIGVHGTLSDDFDGYIGCGISCKGDLKQKHSTVFQKAVIKYGINNFVRETLYEFPGTEKGKIAAYKKEAELVNREFIKRKDVYNSCLGGKVPSSVSEKQVNQYDLEGNFIKTWNSISEASRETGISKSGIGDACLKERKCKDFQWRFFTGSTESISPCKNREKVVYQFDLQGNYITYYKSLHEADRQTGISYKSIFAVCVDKQIQAGGYFWSYKKRFALRASKKNTACASYTLEGKFIKSFTNVKEAAEYMNITPGPIYNVIEGKSKTCKNLRWRYFYGNTSDIQSL